MNKNSLIGSILIAAIVIWWMTMSSNNAKQQAEAQAKEKEAAAAMEAARADSADQLVLDDKTPELKAAPVLGDEIVAEKDSGKAVAGDSAKVASDAVPAAELESVKDSAKVASAAADSVAADSAQATEAPKAIEPRKVTVETDKFIMTLSNKGARVQSVIVKALPDSAGNFPEIIQDTALGALDLKLGKGNVIREGKDITVVATGIMVNEAVMAADILAAEGISTRIIDIHTIKPIDEELIIKAARETGAIVTAEEHSVIGGLGSAVAEVTARNCPVKMAMVGQNDTFGESGKPEELKKKYHMTAEDIVAAVRSLL